MKKSLPYIIPIFRSALFIIGGLLFVAITNQSLNESTKWWPVLCILFNVITILVLVLVCKYEGSDYWDLIHYKKGQLNFKNILLIIILMLSIGVGGMYVFGLAIYGYVPTILIQPSLDNCFGHYLQQKESSGTFDDRTWFFRSGNWHTDIDIVSIPGNI